MHNLIDYLPYFSIALFTGQWVISGLIKATYCPSEIIMSLVWWLKVTESHPARDCYVLELQIPVKSLQK